MGIPLLVRHHERIHARLPLRLTLQVDNSHLETGDELFKKNYSQVGRGSLRSIGIDGSVILHATTVITDGKLNIDISINNAYNKIIEYIKTILTFFDIYNNNNNNNNNNNTSPIIFNFVVDGLPLQEKNRRWRKPDAYSQMSLTEKKILHENLVEKLSIWAKDNGLKFLTNALLKHTERGEGEMALYTLCRSIYEKHYKNDPSIKNVIVSNDSDIIAMMILLNDPTTVVITPATHAIYITNLELISQGLQLNNNQLIQYVIMHFIFFGSDYNLGLMPCPTESKQKIIKDAIKENIKFKPLDIEKVAANCIRRKRKIDDNDNDHETFKKLIIFEAIMAIFYYVSVGNPTPIRKYSPNIYRLGLTAKRKLPFISFGEYEGGKKKIKNK